MIKTFSIGGIHPKDYKLDAESPSMFLDLPKQVCILANQHLGEASQICVKKGDVVKVGQVLTTNTAFIGSVVHSSVSGTVSKVGEALGVSGYLQPAIFIDVEGDEWLPEIDRTDTLIKDITLDSSQIIQRVKEMGIVGLGGACFPTHVKLSVPSGEKAEYLIVNGVECEPFLTDDYRLMMEKGREILVGIAILMKALGVKKAYLGIENNKPKAISALREWAKEMEGIEIVPLKLKYPQGAEKQLIKAIVGREVPSGKLPIHIGCVVNNVGTCFAVYEAVQKNKPLIERLVTVTGLGFPRSVNIWCRIGTSCDLLIEKAGGLPENTSKLIHGGPMMGKAVGTTQLVVSKGSSALLVVGEKEAHRKTPINCIRCGKCSQACPMALEPYLLSAMIEKNKWEDALDHHIMDCIECGCCQYTCVSYRCLLDTIRLGKNKLNQMKMENEESLKNTNDGK